MALIKVSNTIFINPAAVKEIETLWEKSTMLHYIDGTDRRISHVEGAITQEKLLDLISMYLDGRRPSSLNLQGQTIQPRPGPRPGPQMI